MLEAKGTLRTIVQVKGLIETDYFFYSQLSSDFEWTYLQIYNELEGLLYIMLKVFESSFQRTKSLINTTSE